MTTPSGLARARAAATGASVPRAGTFEDLLLKEVDFRERMLSLSHTALFVAMGTRIIRMLGRILNQSNEKLQEAITQESEELLKAYENELFQDRYLDSFKRAERERSRREKQAELERAERDRRAAETVAGFDKD